MLPSERQKSTQSGRSGREMASGAIAPLRSLTKPSCGVSVGRETVILSPPRVPELCYSRLGQHHGFSTSLEVAPSAIRGARRQPRQNFPPGL